MKIDTEREQMRALASNFRQWVAMPYWGLGLWPKGTQHILLAQIEQLDPETATAADVERILGTPDYVRPLRCDECGQETWDTVQLGEPPDYESATARVCLDCLEKAVALLKPGQ